jgi:hypothetical protein
MAWFAQLPVVEKIGWSVLGLVLLGILSVALYLGLSTLNNITDVKDRVGLKIEFVKTVASIFGVLFFLGTLYFTWANLMETQRRNQADLKLAQDKQITELYVKAIEQLGRPTLEERLGGIYALERIAEDSDKYHGPIMEVFTAYVRVNAPWPPEEIGKAQKKRPWAKKRPSEKPKEQDSPAPGNWEPLNRKEQIHLLFKAIEAKMKEETPLDADIQAILTVIGRRSRTLLKGEGLRLVLTRTDLRQAYLMNAHLEGAGLYMSHQEGAFLIGAHLEQADLKETHLEGAFLAGANLEGASFWEAHLEGAFLDSANLKRADLRRAKGLTQEQIDRASCDEKTELPPGLKWYGKKEPQP